MTYRCPKCEFGTLRPARVTYVRSWASRLITIPNFAAWRCDSCRYTRYDRAEIARLSILFGPDEEALLEPLPRRMQTPEGPGERGPHRWIT